MDSPKRKPGRYYALQGRPAKTEINLAALEAGPTTLNEPLRTLQKDFSSGYATETVTYAQGGLLLSDTEAVVDIIRLQGFDEQLVKDSKYVVMVVKRGCPARHGRDRQRQPVGNTLFKIL